MAEIDVVFNSSMVEGHSAAWDQNWGDAVKLYRKAVKVMPSSTLAITSLGLAFYEQKKFKEAIVCYNRAAKLTPDDPLPTDKLADIYEKIGDVDSSIKMSMLSADLHLKFKDAEKSLENWRRVTRLKPEHLKAHFRLAVVQERLGRKNLAVQEYITIGAYLQDFGQVGQALKVVKKAIEADPTSTLAKQALVLIETNKTLPKPINLEYQANEGEDDQKSGIGQSSIALAIDHEKPDLIGEARQKALTALAGKLFDLTSDNIELADDSIQGFLDNLKTGENLEEENLIEISLHIGAAIDYQTMADNEKAANELKQAINHGLNFSAASFNLGLLMHQSGDLDKAQPHLQKALSDPDYSMAAHLLIAEYKYFSGDLNEAMSDYLKALKFADLSVVDQDFKDILSGQYDSLIKSTPEIEGRKYLENLRNNIIGLLLQSDWKKLVIEARSQLQSSNTGRLGLTLAELLSQTENTEMIKTISSVYQIANQGYYRSAMEEAFRILSISPSYLPLHIYMGELLLKQDRVQEAVDKFNTVAATYSARGDDQRSMNLVNRVIEIVPLELSARNHLIQQYINHSQFADAVNEYMKLAEVNYSLAKLEAAMINYKLALQLAEEHQIKNPGITEILHKIADIDMHSLSWRKAEEIYEQIVKKDPEDEFARIQLIEINMRLSDLTQAEFELNNYLYYLSTRGNNEEALLFVKKIIKLNPDMLFARKALAEIFQQIGQNKEAIIEWDKLAEKAVEKGDFDSAREAIRAILMLEPDDPKQYRLMLQQLG